MAGAIGGAAMARTSFVRISSLSWADILVAYAFFVMQNYLTDVWGLSFTHSAAILNIWSGISMILPVFCLYLVDEFLGHFPMLVVGSISYSVGIGFVTMSVPPVLANSTGSCHDFESECIGHTHRVLFYTGMALVAVGISGNKVSLRPFLAEQKDSAETNSGMLSQILGYLGVVIVGVTGAIALPYIKPWTLRFGIPAICTTVGMLLFLSGWSTYKKENHAKGSPITNVFRVFVVFSTKMFKPFDLDSKVYKKNDQEPQSFTRTRFLRCLEKAAMHDSKDDVNNKWRVCSVGEVEEAKIVVRMIPMWMTFIICGIVSSIGNTYFVEQANHMNRRIGKWNVPLQMLLLLSEGSKTIFNCFANRLLYKNETVGSPDDTTCPDTRPSVDKVKVPYEGKRPAYGIGIAMIFSILCCITAARIEKKRLNVIRHHGLLDKPDDDIPMSIYWLLFQFFLLAGLNSFMQKSVFAFYVHQSPDSMKNYPDHFTRGVSGLGFMFSVLTVYVVGQISEDGGSKNWFQFTLNKSRLDRYYWVLAALSAVNLVIFIVVASLYRYKNYEVKDGIDDDDEAFEDPKEGAPEENNEEQNV